jgi:hypothetical protein
MRRWPGCLSGELLNTVCKIVSLTFETFDDNRVDSLAAA